MDEEELLDADGSARDETDDLISIDDKPLMRRQQNDVSTNRTLMNFVKGMIGPGCLSLPIAFKQTGLWMGLVIVFIMGYLNMHGMVMLVNSARHLCSRTGKVEFDYGHLAKTAVDHGHIVRWRAHSRKALYIVNTTIAMLQIGVGSVLYVFMASHIKEVLEHYNNHIRLSIAAYMLILLIPLIVLNWVRTLKVLALFSLFGNVVLFGALFVIFQALFRSPNHIAEIPAVGNLTGIIVGCGSILYAFEGQAMILPMENSMQYPDDMLGPFGVLSIGMALVTIVYASTGFFGYVAFGSNVKGSITLNLPDESTYDLVKMALVLVVYVGFVIQMYIVVVMIWPAIRRKMLAQRCDSFHMPFDYLFRAALVCVTLCIAIAVPNLEHIIPLVGVTSGMLLAFVYPPIIETIVFWDRWQLDSSSHRAWKIGKNIALVTFGLVGMFSGVYSTLSEIV